MVTVDHWLTSRKIQLCKQGKQHIYGGKELTDLHINVFKHCLPTIGGLYNTVVIGRAILTIQKQQAVKKRCGPKIPG